MKITAYLLAVSALVMASVAVAQQPTKDKPQPEGFTSLGQMTPTPEMWFYQEEMRRREDPRVAVREKAEFRAAQRQRRIAAMKWFGLSNSRPVANPTPFTSQYSPGWVSNTHSPYQWSGTTRSSTIINARRGGAIYGLW